MTTTGRVWYGFVLLLTCVGILLAPWAVRTASASQVGNRSVQLSNAMPGASAVSYRLTLTPVATTQELIVDFCSDTPLVGSACSFSSSTVPNVAGASSSAGVVSTVGSGSPVHTLKVTGLTMTGGSPYTITFVITNPGMAGTFFARVLTYSTGAASGYAPANTSGGGTTTGVYVDYGGVAVTVASQINVSATVMETLTFCTSGSFLDNYTTTCAAATPPTLVLGEGYPPVLGSTAVSIGAIYMLLATNAGLGLTARMKALNACTNGGMSFDGGATCAIPGVGSTASVLTPGVAAFGACVRLGAKSQSQGQVVANTYKDTVNGCLTGFSAPTNKFGMNGANVTSTYGDQIFSAPGPQDTSWNAVVFGATTSPTTPAAVYTANESLLVTGNF